LTKRLPNFDSELGFYQIKNSCLEIPEKGVLLSNENVVFLIKETLKRMFLLNIKRSSSFASTSSLRIKLVENPLVHTHTSDDEWIKLNSIQEIDNLDFDVESFFVPVDLESAKQLREDIENSLRMRNEKAKSDVREKKIKSEANKNKKNQIIEEDGN
jgi:hypothetical protein